MYGWWGRRGGGASAAKPPSAYSSGVGKRPAATVHLLRLQHGGAAGRATAESVADVLLSERLSCSDVSDKATTRRMAGGRCERDQGRTDGADPVRRTDSWAVRDVHRELFSFIRSRILAEPAHEAKAGPRLLGVRRHVQVRCPRNGGSDRRCRYHSGERRPPDGDSVLGRTHTFHRSRRGLRVNGVRRCTTESRQSRGSCMRTLSRPHPSWVELCA